MTQTLLPKCALCANEATHACSACSKTFFCSNHCETLLKPTHEVLCGRDRSTFYLPLLSEQEANKLNVLRDRPIDHKELLYCECPDGQCPEWTLWEFVRSLGLARETENWESFLSNITVRRGEDQEEEEEKAGETAAADGSRRRSRARRPVSDEPDRSTSLLVARSQLCLLRFTPTVAVAVADSSSESDSNELEPGRQQPIGLEPPCSVMETAFNATCQAAIRFFVTLNPSNPQLVFGRVRRDDVAAEAEQTTSPKLNPFQTLNEPLRIVLSYLTMQTHFERINLLEVRNERDHLTANNFCQVTEAFLDKLSNELHSNRDEEESTGSSSVEQQQQQQQQLDDNSRRTLEWWVKTFREAFEGGAAIVAQFVAEEQEREREEEEAARRLLDAGASA